MGRCTLWELQRFREPGMGPIDRVPRDKLAEVTWGQVKATHDACPFGPDGIPLDPRLRFTLWRPESEKLRQRWTPPPDMLRSARLLEQSKSHLATARAKLIRQLAQRGSFSGHHNINARGEALPELDVLHGQIPGWSQRRRLDERLRVLDHRLRHGTAALPALQHNAELRRFLAAKAAPPHGFLAPAPSLPAPPTAQARPWALDRFGHALAAPQAGGAAVLEALADSDFSVEEAPWAGAEEALGAEERERRRAERRRRKRKWSQRLERLKLLRWTVQDAEARRAERKIAAQVQREAREAERGVINEPRRFNDQNVEPVMR